jgi:hypothetical protein
MACAFRLAHQFGSFSEIRAVSCGCDNGCGFATTYNPPCPGGSASGDINGSGFARNGGVIDQCISSNDTNVGGDDIANAKVDDVVRHNAFGGDSPPVSITADANLNRQTLPQERQSPPGVAFLYKAQSRIEQEQDTDNYGFNVLVEQKLEHNRRLKHPGNRRPKLAQDSPQWVTVLFCYCIRSELRQPLRRLR